MVQPSQALASHHSSCNGHHPFHHKYSRQIFMLRNSAGLLWWARGGAGVPLSSRVLVSCSRQVLGAAVSSYSSSSASQPPKPPAPPAGSAPPLTDSLGYASEGAMMAQLHMQQEEEARKKRASGQGDAGNDEEGSRSKQKTHKPRFKLRYVAAAGLPWLLYTRVRAWLREQEEKRLEKELVAVGEMEVRRMARRTKLTSRDIMGVWGEVRRRYAPGDMVAPDLFGAVVKEAAVDAEKKLLSWETNCFFRTQPLDALDRWGRMDTGLLVTGLALLAYDERELREGEGAPVDEYGNPKPVYNHESKLDVAWAAALVTCGEQAGDRRLGFDALVMFVERLVRTGHIEPRSVLRQVGWWPIQFRVASSSELARLIYSENGLSAEDGDRISKKQFRRAAYALARARTFALWYMRDIKLTNFGHWRIALYENLLRRFAPDKVYEEIDARLQKEDDEQQQEEEEQ